MVAIKEMETKEELKNYIEKAVALFNRESEKDESIPSLIKEYIHPIAFLLKLFTENPSESLNKELEPILGKRKGGLGKESYSIEAITSSIIDGTIYKAIDSVERHYKDNFSWRLMESYTEYENVYVKVNFILDLVDKYHARARI